MRPVGKCGTACAEFDQYGLFSGFVFAAGATGMATGVGIRAGGGAKLVLPPPVLGASFAGVVLGISFGVPPSVTGGAAAPEEQPVPAEQPPQADAQQELLRPAKRARSLSRRFVFEQGSWHAGAQVGAGGQAGAGSQAGAQEVLHLGASRARSLSRSLVRDEQQGSPHVGAAGAQLVHPACTIGADPSPHPI